MTEERAGKEAGYGTKIEDINQEKEKWKGEETMWENVMKGEGEGVTSDFFSLDVVGYLVTL